GDAFLVVERERAFVVDRAAAGARRRSGVGGSGASELHVVSRAGVALGLGEAHAAGDALVVADDFDDAGGGSRELGGVLLGAVGPPGVVGVLRATAIRAAPQADVELCGAGTRVAARRGNGWNRWL